MTEENTLYTLTVTPAQLEIIAKACETCARASIGQFNDILNYCRDKDNNYINSYELTQLVESIIKPKMGLHMNASFSIGTFKHADNLFDIYQTIRHRLAWDHAYATGIIKKGEKRNFIEMMSVHYDPPMNVGDQPLPLINNQPPAENELH